MTSRVPMPEPAEGFSPGDRVLWSGKNGTVRHGVIESWESYTGRWFVRFDPDPTIHSDGFATWFTAADLIKVDEGGQR